MNDRELLEILTDELTKCSKAYGGLKAENEALREALAEERRVRLLGQEPDVHWESLRDIRRACYAKTDAALARAGEKK